MAIPAEQELVKHYTVTFAADDGAGTAKDVFYTLDGTSNAADLSPQLQGQGVAVFVQNPSSETGITVSIYAKTKIYGDEFDVFLGSFEVGAGEDGGYAVGFGLMRKGMKMTITNNEAVTSATDVVVAIVPSNG